MSLAATLGPRPAGRIAVLVYFSPPPAADKVISTISLAAVAHGEMRPRRWRPFANGPLEKRSAASGTAVTTLLSRHISHQSSGTGFGIRRFDAL
jgi:hypothetical protein